MIHKLILRNFKKVKEETFLFDNFDLIVGSNNSGKSTILQSLAIWQYCVEQFRLSKKKGQNGIQIVLPNFTALPVPEFNLLWKDKTDRRYEDDLNTGKKNQIYIYIEIDVYWKNRDGKEKNFCVQMRYQSPQAVYAKPLNGWVEFNQLNQNEDIPHIVYVPPFSGLETSEKWLDDGNVRQNVGKAQPGSVLRNLLYRVIDTDNGNQKKVSIEENEDWKEIKRQVQNWFGIELVPPQYEKGISTEIASEYKENKKTFDIISGGSGFHQILTLLAFMYGYKGTTTILFDEPDAHLHVNLQRQILNYIKQHSQIQFLIATHSEEFIKNVEVTSILSILSGEPKRVQSTNTVISAMNLVDNIDVVRTQDKPYILYVEGEDDERILSAWANTLEKTDVYQKFYPYILGGSTKKEMQEKADRHYEALKQIVPNLKRAILLDYDNDEAKPHAPANQIVFNEWKRKNIDNYLLVPQAWKRAIAKNKEYELDELFLQPYSQVIDAVFNEQNLTLPKGSTWKNVKAQIFSLVDGKKLLFENQDSLFEQIENVDNDQLKINRSMVASAMTSDEIHDDIDAFFSNLEKIVEI
ncbi:chromosome segregation protein SMC [Bacteroidia bacterium]|nr:chromosome segregation protein SMC [Bacteroidia bacterium]